MPNQPHKYVFLDGLRGIAAAAVMYSHLLLTGDRSLPQAAYSVDFFFILSGFVLAYAYTGKLRDNMSVAQFMVIRYKRLYPMLLLAVALAFAISIFRGSWDIWWVAGALTGLPRLNSIPHQLAFPLVGPEWSLSYEFAVNLLFSIAIRKSKCLVLTVAFAAVYIVAAYQGYGLSGSDSNNFLFGMPRVLFGFMAGVALWFIVSDSPIKYSRLIACAITALLLCFLLASRQSIGLNTAAIVLVLPAIIGTGSRVRLTGSVARICSALGEMSYPLYILHYPLTWVVAGINRRLQSKGLALLIVEGILIMAASMLIAIYIDVPVRRRLRQLRTGPSET